MPSTTRGSILISTANDIGEALVEKLGGVGYSPNEWKEKYNLCGIAPVDSAPALSVLADSAGTGDERGSILIATADAIGAILNKKYNVLRGFKPKEWASACRKMKALEEGSVASSSIASFSDGADTVPLTSCVCNIDANLDGKSAVNAVHAGVNLFNKNAITPNTWIVVNSTDTEAAISYSTSDYIPVKANTKYYVSTKSSNRSAYYDRNKNGIAYFSFSGGASFTALYDGYIRLTINNNIDLDTFIVNEGDTQATYEAYKGETKTADLGRTIYGGTADIVNGTGTEEYANTSLTDKNYYYSSSLQRFDCALDGVISSGYMDDFIPPQGYTINHVLIVDGANAPDYTMCIFGGKLYIKNLSCSNVSDLVSDMSGKYITYSLATPTDFTFTGQEVPTRLGYNAFWSDSGDTAVDYYKAPTPYARKTATGGIANFSDQRTDLPLTKAIANIAPSIAGKSAVNLVRAGKNLFDKGNPNVVDGYITTTGFSTSNTSAKTVYIPIVGGATYTVSKTAGQRFQIATAEVEPTNNAVFTNRQAGNTNTSLTITASANDKYLWAWIFLDGTDSGTLAEMLNSVQIEVGSSASAYVPYQAPTTYTAELGETVYGGSVDFVSGEVKQVIKKKTVSSFNGTYGAVNNGYAYYIVDADTTHITSAVDPSNMIANQLFTYGSAARGSAPTWQYGGNDGNNQTHTFILPSDYDTLAKANNFLASLQTPLEVTLTLATPIESAIPGRVISPIEGVNNYWNDAGGDTEIQYFEDET